MTAPAAAPPMLTNLHCQRCGRAAPNGPLSPFAWLRAHWEFAHGYHPEGEGDRMKPCVVCSKPTSTEWHFFNEKGNRWAACSDAHAFVVVLADARERERIARDG